MGIPIPTAALVFSNMVKKGWDISLLKLSGNLVLAVQYSVSLVQWTGVYSIFIHPHICSCIFDLAIMDIFQFGSYNTVVYIVFVCLFVLCLK